MCLDLPSVWVMDSVKSLLKILLKALVSVFGTDIEMACGGQDIIDPTGRGSGSSKFRVRRERGPLKVLLISPPRSFTRHKAALQKR